MSSHILSRASLQALGCRAFIPFAGNIADSGPARISTTLGSALSFPKHQDGNRSAYGTGSAGHILLPASTINLDNASFSMMANVRIVNYAGFRGIVVHDRASGYATRNTVHFGIRISGKITAAFYGDDLDSVTTMPTNEWVHIAITYDAVTRRRRIYINGILDAEDTAGGNLSGTSSVGYRVGRSTASDYIYGDMRNVAIFDNELPSFIVQQFHAATRILPDFTNIVPFVDPIINGKFDGTTTGWTFEGPSPATVTDTSPYEGSYCALVDYQRKCAVTRGTRINQTITIPDVPGTLKLEFYERTYVDTWGNSGGIKFNDTWIWAVGYSTSGRKGVTTSWAKQSVDISSYKGQTVQLAITWHDPSSQYCAASDHDGWIRVDDIKIIQE